MGRTRIEQAIDEIEPLGDDYEPTCDDIRLAWIADDCGGGSDFDALWTDR
jgi:hypothetical protein